MENLNNYIINPLVNKYPLFNGVHLGFQKDGKILKDKGDSVIIYFLAYLEKDEQVTYEQVTKKLDDITKNRIKRAGGADKWCCQRNLKAWRSIQADIKSLESRKKNPLIKSRTDYLKSLKDLYEYWFIENKVDFDSDLITTRNKTYREPIKHRQTTIDKHKLVREYYIELKTEKLRAGCKYDDDELAEIVGKKYHYAKRTAINILFKNGYESP